MNITIFGTGYVGLVTGICFAELGHHVVCLDIDDQKIARLQRGQSIIYEPGLSTLLERHLNSGHIIFSSDIKKGAQHGLFQFIAVGTPANDDGSADLSAVYKVAESIGQYMQDYCLVINKSTVPVGTADQVKSIICDQLKDRAQTISFDIASNPEFLREGAAIHDFMNPDRIIVGANNQRALDYMRELYMPLIDAGRRFIAMDIPSAELTKYASNAYLAAKISFINEMSHIAERLGADIDQVRRGMSMDPRIGEHFLFPGCGYGGSCFPKDVQALQRTAKDVGYHALILEAIEAVNKKQKSLLVHKIKKFFQGDLSNKVVAVWGLAFKPNTDDMREASSRSVLEDLWNEGALVKAYDPIAMQEAQRIYGIRSDFELCESLEATLEGADVLTIVTEWDHFKTPNFSYIKEKLRHCAVFDGRNIYDPSEVEQHGLIYYGIGRGKRYGD